MAIPLRLGQKSTRIEATKDLKSRRSHDPRMWLGILLLIGSTIFGQTIFTRASARTPAVSIVSDIAAGSMIRESDISISQVAVPNPDSLLAIPSEVIGKFAAVDLVAGDLITKHSITAGAASDSRLVSVPIRAGHLPLLAHGSKVDVWMTPATDGVALPGPAQLIIPSAVLDAVPNVSDQGMDTSVTLQITDIQVQALVQAMRDGVIDLVAIPSSSS
jgi:hypothetical protein